jgi:ABC-2 type transport system permease protein
VISALYRLFLRSVARRGRIAALGGLGVVGVAIALVARADDRVDAGARFVNAYGLVVVVPIVCLVFASAVLGDLQEDGTLVYLWLKPVERWRIVLAAAMAVATVVFPLVGVPMLVAAAVTGDGADLLVGTAAAVGVGLVAYSGLFLWLGLRVRRSLAVGLAYIMIWEGFVARAGDSASRLAIRSYTRSVLSHATGAEFELGDVTQPWAVVVPLAVGIAALALATRRLRRQDVA